MRSSATAEVATGAGWRTAVALATGSAAFALSVAVLFPGWMSYDSSFQFWQVRTGEFSNLSPVVMTALWSVVHAVAPRPSALFLLHQAAYWTGIVLLALALWRGAAARAAFIVVAGFVPPVFVILGHLWTDASLIAALSLAFGLTVTGLVRRQRWSLALALPAILYAGAVRHNSLLAIVPLAALWAHALLRAGADGHVPAPVRSRRAKLAGIALLLVFASFAGGRALDQALARERVSTWALVALWDLAAISLDSRTTGDPGLCANSRDQVSRVCGRGFRRTPAYHCSMVRAVCATVWRAKNSMLRNSPSFGVPGWLRSRRTLGHTFGIGRLSPRSQFGSYRGHAEGLFFVPTTVAYRDNPPGEAALTGWRDRLVEGVRRTRGWVIFTPAVYLVIAFGAAALGWRRRDELAGQVALAVAGSGLFLVLPLVVAAPGSELRYCGWLFTSSVVALAACFARPAARASTEPLAGG